MGTTEKTPFRTILSPNPSFRRYLQCSFKTGKNSVFTDYAILIMTKNRNCKNRYFYHLRSIHGAFRGAQKHVFLVFNGQEYHFLINTVFVVFLWKHRSSRLPVCFCFLSKKKDGNTVCTDAQIMKNTVFSGLAPGTPFSPCFQSVCKNVGFLKNTKNTV